MIRYRVISKVISLLYMGGDMDMVNEMMYAEERELIGEPDHGLLKTALKLERLQLVLWDLEDGIAATSSRDYGRGVATAVRRIKEVLDD